MTVLLVLLALLMVLLVWVLLAPINFYVNTWEKLALVELYGIAGFRISWQEEKLLLRLRIFFFEFTPKGGNNPKKKKKPRRKKAFSSGKLPGLAKQFLQTFHVKKLILKMDTGDYPANAKLIPLFVLINAKDNVSCTVNFTGELGLEFLIQNRLSRMLPVIFKMRKLFSTLKK